MSHEIRKQEMTLPEIPMFVHSVAGEGLRTDKLIMVYEGFDSPEGAMAAYRAQHPLERTSFRCCFWYEPMRDGTVVVRFIPDLKSKPNSHPIIGSTVNDVAAIKILIANARSGCFMGSCSRWELYEDPCGENLVDLGRFDQWDFLSGTSLNRIESLPSDKRPAGNWDFWKLLLARRCQCCGNTVSINCALYSIDSAACDKCGNRPFLSSAIHGLLGQLKGLTGENVRVHTRVLQWISSVMASLPEVKKCKNDDGATLRGILDQSLIMDTCDPSKANRVRGLIETNMPGVNFSMFKAGCETLRDALLGKVPFYEETMLTANFVMGVIERMRVRAISTHD